MALLLKFGSEELNRSWQEAGDILKPSYSKVWKELYRTFLSSSLREVMGYEKKCTSYLRSVQSLWESERV